MVELAAKCLLSYFETFGSRNPGDLEDDFCGEPETFEIMSNLQGRWRKSPFYPALAHLVDRGMVQYWRDSSGYVWYDLSKTARKSNGEEKRMQKQCECGSDMFLNEDEEWQCLSNNHHTT